MLGRENEREAIRGLLASASASTAGVIAVIGDAGMGKTMLCRYGREAAETLGFRVVEVAGVEWESDFQLAALSQVLRTLSDATARLPRRQRELLDTALGPQRQGHREYQDAPDLHSLAAATLACLAAAAERENLLIIVDDIQWIDRTSAGVLNFAFCRLDADSIAVLLAGRPDGGSSGSGSFNCAHRVLTLAPLSASEMLSLIETLRPDIGVPGAELLAALERATAGNPLALHDLAPQLTSSISAGRARLPELILLSAQGRASVGPTINRLPERTRTALGVVALAGGQPELIDDCLDCLGLEAADLDSACDAGLITGGTSPTFTHPLRRAAANEALTQTTRRRIHATLAELTASSNPDRRAHHLDASGAPAEVVAEAMVTAARHTASHAGRAASASLWTRAAQLTAPTELRDERRVAAATALTLAGDLSAAEVLVAAVLDHPVPDATAVAATVLRGQLASWMQPPLSELTRWRDDVIDRDKSAACQLSVIAAHVALTYAQMEAAHRLALQAVELAASPEVADEVRTVAELAAIHTGMLSRGGAQVPRQIDELPVEKIVAAFRSYVGQQFVASHAACLAEAFEFATDLSARLIAVARESSAFGALPGLLLVHAEITWWTGDWTTSSACAGEGRSLAAQVGQGPLTNVGLGHAATLAASMGRRAECESAANQALALFSGPEAVTTALYSQRALGLLELSEGRFDAAIEHLRVVDAAYRAGGVAQPTLFAHQGDLAEALIRSGDKDAAAVVLAGLQDAAARSGSRWAHGVLLRNHALLDPDAPDSEEWLRASVEAHDTAQLPFEAARSQFALGRYLRRRHRPGEAREPLRQAASTFARLGAQVWSGAVDAERRAAGDWTRGGPELDGASLASRLSPQQLQICLQVAAGASNRQIASTLFLSPKTVDYHLRRAYAALGIRSRVELVRIVARQHPHESAP